MKEEQKSNLEPTTLGPQPDIQELLDDITPTEPKDKAYQQQLREMQMYQQDQFSQ